MIVSASFYPLYSPRANRTTELAKELARQGHRVTVVIPDLGFVYTSFEQKHKIVIKSLGKLKNREIKLGTNRLLRTMERLVFRLLHALLEYPAIELMFKVRRTLKYERDYDLLISIAVPYPIHWGVVMAHRKKSPVALRWVADCGDPYTGFGNKLFYKAFYLRLLTRKVFKECDFITVPFTGAVTAYPKNIIRK